jgi:hypothetical protein
MSALFYMPLHFSLYLPFCTIGSRQFSEQVDRARFPIRPRIFLNAAILRPDMESFKPIFTEVKLSEPSVKAQNTLSRFGGDYRRGVYWWMDLLTTYTHHWDIQVINSAIADLHTSQMTTASVKPFPACCYFTGSSLAMDSKSGTFSASRSHVLSSQPSVQNSTELTTINWTSLPCRAQLNWLPQFPSL